MSTSLLSRARSALSQKLDERSSFVILSPLPLSVIPSDLSSEASAKEEVKDLPSSALMRASSAGRKRREQIPRFARDDRKGRTPMTGETEGLLVMTGDERTLLVQRDPRSRNASRRRSGRARGIGADAERPWLASQKRRNQVVCLPAHRQPVLYSPPLEVFFLRGVAAPPEPSPAVDRIRELCAIVGLSPGMTRYSCL